jgi:hypothetical protein
MFDVVVLLAVEETARKSEKNDKYPGRRDLRQTRFGSGFHPERHFFSAAREKKKNTYTLMVFWPSGRTRMRFPTISVG